MRAVEIASVVGMVPPIEHKVFITSLLMLFTAIILRQCSSDEPKFWWKCIVVSIFGCGLVSMLISAMIIIWT